MITPESRHKISSLAFDITDLIFKTTLPLPELKKLKAKHGIKKLFKDADLAQLSAFHAELTMVNASGLKRL